MARGPKSRNRNRTIFRKRKQELVTKLNELTQQCGVDAFMIIERNHRGVQEFETWPENRQEVEQMIARFRADRDLDKKHRDQNANLSNFLEDSSSSSLLEGLSRDQLIELRAAAESKLEDLRKRMESIQASHQIISDVQKENDVGQHDDDDDDNEVNSAN